MHHDVEHRRNLMSYEFEDVKVADIISKNSTKKVLIQLPDGLKPFGLKLINTLRNRTHATFYFSADPCYGACDLAVDAAKIVGADLIIHYGHTPITVSTDVKVVYINAKSEIPIENVINKTLAIIKPYRKIGLITNLQHVHKLEEVKYFLERNGKTVFTGSAGGLVKYDGQILGCDYTTAEKIKNSVDIFLYIGGGHFHPLGVMLSTKKPVVVADPFRSIVENLFEAGSKLLEMRKAALAKLIEAENVGIIVGLKMGQAKPDIAERIQEKLESRGKRTMLLCIREITPEVLDNFEDVEVFINTACPRIGVDDQQNFRRPIVSLRELEELLAGEDD